MTQGDHPKLVLSAAVKTYTDAQDKIVDPRHDQSRLEKLRGMRGTTEVQLLERKSFVDGASPSPARASSTTPAEGPDPERRSQRRHGAASASW